jgi:hypothetical protein
VDRLVRACALTCTADTRLHFAFDDDDDQREASIKAAAGHRYTVGPRQGLAAWTNELAARHVKRLDTRALASIGDDMVPVTHGWDEKLLGALPLRGGFSWPEVMRTQEQGRDPTVPEAIVISAGIVAALGWMAMDKCTHWYIDNVWRDLGNLTGSIVHCPDVVIKHMHPNVPGGDRPDQTYHDAARSYAADNAAYAKWRMFRMRADALKIQQAREAAA